MSDLTLLNSAQNAYQRAQTQKMTNMASQAQKAEGKSFADQLSAKQMKDPSFMDAMQRRKIKETAVEFEAQFLSQMLSPMFEGLNAEEPFGGGHAEKMWQSMLVEQYGKSIAKSGGIGLAENIERQLLRAQEGL